MASTIKRAVFQLGKWTGLFKVSRRLTRGQLRILCYHGVALSEESAFRPGLFIEPDVFAQRLDYLRSNGFTVLPLAEAVERLEADALPPDAAVITIDDGFFSTGKHAVEALASRGLPATLYVTTYYVDHANPIFRLAVQWLFWKSEEREVDFGGLGIEGLGVERIDPRDPECAALWKIIRHGEARCDEAGRRALSEQVGALLGVSYAELVESRALSLMTPDEIRAAAERGIDIQLHTHRHRFPEDDREAAREISDNRSRLETWLGRKLTHLCYPSGYFSKAQFPLLERQGIQSATTCEPGFNDPDDHHRFALRRFLDSAEISQIEFEAELSGFSELLRRARDLVRSVAARAPEKQARPHEVLSEKRIAGELTRAAEALRSQTQARNEVVVGPVELFPDRRPKAREEAAAPAEVRPEH